jgi:hypothetical protein
MAERDDYADNDLPPEPDLRKEAKSFLVGLLGELVGTVLVVILGLAGLALYLWLRR